MPPTIRVHGAVQDTPQDRQHFNLANHRLADYHELRDVNDLYIRGLSTFACDQQPCHQDPVVPYVCPNVGFAQGAPGYEQVISPVCTNLSLMHRLPTGFPAGPPRIPWFGVCPSGNCTRPYPDRLSRSIDSPAARPWPTGGRNLRRLASHYVHHPDSQVDMVRMEPGTVGRYEVVIELEMTYFL